MSAPFLAALEAQARACDGLGSPFTARVMRGLAKVWPSETALARRVAGWTGDLGPRGASLPLRVAGGLHALVRAGAAEALLACYPPRQAPDPALARALRQTLLAQDAALCAFVETAPQTNEVGRSAVLLAGAADLAARFGLPLRLSELGASAGLNLWFDRYALDLPSGVLGRADSAVRLRPDWRGALPPLTPLHIEAGDDGRRGVDLNPLDPARDGARLMAFVWPDQTERMARLDAALHLAEGGRVETGDAADWLEARLARPWQDVLHLVFHTIAFQYFPAATQARIGRAMEQAGARATPRAPLAWLAMEADAGAEGAAVTLRLWPGAHHHDLGRAGFHGQWVDWRGAGRVTGG